MGRTVTLRPGARGTIGLTQIYGQELICVRYRYDDQMRRRQKTIELVVDEVPWTPPEPDWVQIRTYVGESSLRRSIIESGGQWDSHRRLWLLRKDAARKLDLLNRVVEKK